MTGEKCGRTTEKQSGGMPHNENFLQPNGTIARFAATELADRNGVELGSCDEHHFGVAPSMWRVTERPLTPLVVLGPSAAK